MVKNKPMFSILITTKNRKNDLVLTLEKINHLLERKDVECIICVDGSSDDTFSFVEKNHPSVLLYKNQVSKGYLFTRNFLLSKASAPYAVSLDDDAHFISDNPLPLIKNYFKRNPKCGLIAFRIYWNTTDPNTTDTRQKPEKVKGFVGCGHVWRMEAWRSIPAYPEWFVFYGEEDFAAYQLFLKQWEIHYLPEVLVHHRVSLSDRRKQKDYVYRLRNSLSSGWYLYFLFFPWIYIPRKMIYSIWTQLRLKVFRGDFKAFFGMILAMSDLVKNFPRLLKYRNSLTTSQIKMYDQLNTTHFYWKEEFE